MTYVALALGTIALGLWVHRGGTALNADVRDMLGDALWAAMMVWWISAVAPRRNLATRASVAYASCCAVEFSQLFHTPMLDATRRTTAGRLVLGSGFDPRDLLAYALGVLLAAWLDTIIRRRAVEGGTSQHSTNANP